MCGEKKAVNTLLAEGRKENHDIFSAAKTSIKESETVKFWNTLKGKKLEQRAKTVKTAKIIRKERMKTFQKHLTAKEKLSEEKNGNKEPHETIRVMQKKQSALENELYKTNLSLVNKVQKVFNLETTLEADKNRLHNEKRKRYLSTDEKNWEIKVKDTELSELRKTMFKETDEIKVTEKETRNGLKIRKRLMILHCIDCKKYAQPKEKRKGVEIH